MFLGLALFIRGSSGNLPTSVINLLQARALLGLPLMRPAQRPPSDLPTHTWMHVDGI